MKDRDLGRVARPILLASVLPALVACSDQPLEVSYAVKASVHTLENRNNPRQNNADLMFPEIPDWVEGEPQERLSVPMTGFFYASCRAKQVFGKDKLDLWSAGVQSWYEPGSAVAHVEQLDNNDGKVEVRKEYIVNKKQWAERVREVTLKIGSRIIGKSQARNENEFLSGTGEIVRAVELPFGENKVSCSFETWSGTIYQSEATVEVTDNRT